MVTERNTKTEILAAYEELKTENKALRTENKILLEEVRKLTPPPVELPRAIKHLKYTLREGRSAEGPWEALRLKQLPNRQVSLWMDKMFHRENREISREFMGDLAADLKARGHQCQWRIDHLRVTLKPEPYLSQPPSDSIQDEPNFNEQDDGPSDEALAAMAEDAALAQAERAASELI